MKKKTKKEANLKKIDQAFEKMRRTLVEDPVWQEWVDFKGLEFLERASKELEKIKPSLEEMLLDLVEAGWMLENPGGDFSILAKKKRDVITALWKLTQIIKGHYPDGQEEKPEWRKQPDG